MLISCTDEDQGNITVTSMNYNIPGLHGGSTYSIRETASNAAGSSEVSNPANGVTREAGQKLPLLLALKVYVPLTAPSAPPSSVTVTDVTSSTISVQWGSVPCIHQNGDITGYSVQYEVMGCGNTETMSVPGADTTQTTISGLTPSTTYSIQVAAVNNQLIGQYTVEPPKRGHFGNGTFVLSSEVVLFSEVV